MPAVILKRIQHLMPDDLAAYPVWVECHIIDYDEPWYEDTDEETFRPWDGSLPIDPSVATFLVRARFTLADGSPFDGFVTPHGGHQDREGNSLASSQPRLFLPSGAWIAFWHGRSPWPEMRERLYSELRRPPESVFPIRFATCEGLAQGIGEGQIYGFTTVQGGGGLQVAP